MGISGHLQRPAALQARPCAAIFALPRQFSVFDAGDASIHDEMQDHRQGKLEVPDFLEQRSDAQYRQARRV